MVDVARLTAFTDALGKHGLVDAATLSDLRAARDAVAACPDGDPGLQGAVDAYLAALAPFTADPDNQLDLVMSSIGFLGSLDGIVRPAVRTALAETGALDTDLTLGPADLAVGAPNLTVRGAHIAGMLPIDGLALAIDAGSLKASGAGYINPAARSAGGLIHGDLGVVGLTVAAVVTDASGLSLLALLRADFRPAGIQLGLGFSLDSVGGMFGVNRAADVDEIRRRLGDGSAADALFGGAATTSAAILSTLRALDAMFPAAAGQYVVGPTLRLGWLNVGGTSLVSLDVGVILALPRGQVVVPGRAVLDIGAGGASLVHLRADLLGVVDPAARRITLDAALVDSQVFGQFSLSGTATGYFSWGEPATVILAVGGFYPGYDPRPAQIPPQRRIALNLTSPLPGLQMSAEGYVAATTGTLQMGGSISAAYDFDIAAVRGSVGGDALIQMSPLWFTARFHGSASIEALGQDVASVNCTAVLTGPGPLTLSVSASTTILWEDVGGTIDFVLSGGPGMDRAPADVLAGVVKAAFDDTANVAAEAGKDPYVRPAPRLLDHDGRALVAPTGALVWHQDQFPLDVPVEKAAGRVLGAVARVALTNPAGSARVTERLATSAFVDLSDSAALAVPPYERHEVGLRIPVSPGGAAAATTTTTDYELVIHPDPDPTPGSAFLGLALGLAAALRAARGAPALLATAAPPATVVSEAVWVAADDLGSFSTAMSPAAAVAEARVARSVVAFHQAAVGGVA